MTFVGSLVAATVAGTRAGNATATGAGVAGRRAPAARVAQARPAPRFRCRQSAVARRDAALPSLRAPRPCDAVIARIHGRAEYAAVNRSDRGHEGEPSGHASATGSAAAPPPSPSPYERALGRVKFNADGLVPAVAQDARTHQVLMLAYMSRESLAETLCTKRAVYYSRSRQSLWRKGDTSGQVQHVRDVVLDCDGDAVLLRVEQVGVACHTGRASCFFRRFADATERQQEEDAGAMVTGVTRRDAVDDRHEQAEADEERLFEVTEAVRVDPRQLYR